MLQWWQDLTFLHWPLEREHLQQLLPGNLDVDTFDGAAWIGLVAFRLTVRAPGVPKVPWASAFPEINLRTYVRGPDGRAGIWFLSLEAPRLGAVVAARAWYQLPYLWAAIEMTKREDSVTYTSRRRWPALARPRVSIDVKVGKAIAAEVSDLERFLIGRWRLYSPRSGGLVATQVEHGPWPLHEARLIRLDEELTSTAGLPRPDGEPLVHFSPGVATRFAGRQWLGPRG